MRGVNLKTSHPLPVRWEAAESNSSKLVGASSACLQAFKSDFQARGQAAVDRDRPTLTAEQDVRHPRVMAENLGLQQAVATPIKGEPRILVPPNPNTLRIKRTPPFIRRFWLGLIIRGSLVHLLRASLITAVHFHEIFVIRMVRLI